MTVLYEEKSQRAKSAEWPSIMFCYSIIMWVLATLHIVVLTCILY